MRLLTPQTRLILEYLGGFLADMIQMPRLQAGEAVLSLFSDWKNSHEFPLGSEILGKFWYVTQTEVNIWVAG